jgi:steroid delta-isomerase-like uncharacterized protein
MLTNEERNLGARWFEEVWNQQRREAIEEMMAPDAVLHEAGRDSVGPAAFHEFYDRLNSAFSNIRITVHDTIIDGDRACLRWEASLKHTGDGLGLPPTQKTIHVTGITIVRIANNKLVEAWQNWDMMGMMEQIHDKGRSATYVSAG